MSTPTTRVPSSGTLRLPTSKPPQAAQQQATPEEPAWKQLTPEERAVRHAESHRRDRETQREAKEHRRQRAAALLVELRTKWPHLFTVPVPLAIGIGRELAAALGAGHSATLNAALRHWTTRPAYLRAVASGRHRTTLDGSDAGSPDERAREYARESLAERLKDYPPAPQATPPTTAD